MVLRLTLEYDGRDFAGWQIQPGGARTVQGTLVRALGALPGTWGPVHGAGRTDAGAHAEGQVASVGYEGPLDVRRLRGAINAHLPPDVVVLDAVAAEPGFHARFSAVAREYRYRFLGRPTRPALARGRCWWLGAELDEGGMREALPALLGRHDWTTYRVAPRGEEEERDPVRELFAATLSRRDVFLDLHLVGEGFLRGQVRGVAGALAEVGLGRHAPSWPGELLAARDRLRAPQTAPAWGLTLVTVSYGDLGAAG